MSNIPQFTAREISIARLVYLEKTDSEIAYQLGISTQHAKNVQVELKRKLGVVSRVGIALAVQRGEVR